MRHSSPLLNALTSIIALAAILLTLGSPDTAASSELWVLAVSIAWVGIPHGALDHLIAADVYRQGNTLRDHLLFYGWYLLLMFIVAALWIFAPLAGFLLFMAISVYHFGQGDVEAFFPGMDYARMAAASVSRGMLIIGLILSAHPEQSIPIIEAALGGETSFTIWLTVNAGLITAVMIGQFALVQLIFAWMEREDHRSAARFLIDSVLVTFLFLIAPPLLAFAIYFAMWHSIGHIGEIRGYFESQGSPLTVSGFFLRALPFTLVSFAGLAILVWLTSSFSLQNQVVSLTFILISVLTLPHMVVANSMLRAPHGKA